MKKVYIIATLIAMMGIIGCEKTIIIYSGDGGPTTDKPTGPPVIEVAPTLTLSAEGGIESLPYTIVNAVDGQQISASCDQDWVHSFDYSTEGKIKFKYAAYSDEENDRTATLTLTYPGAGTKTVNVFQIRKGGFPLEI